MEKTENVEVIITKEDFDWPFIREACMDTIGKDSTSKEPSSEWKKRLILCEHSPIRRGNVSWKWKSIPYAMSTHYVRHHEGCEKYVKTSRSDRTGVDRSTRSQMDEVVMSMDANIQALINISKKRLCTSADKDTRKYWIALLKEIKKIAPEVYWACVPECVHSGGCREYKNCGFYDKLFEGRDLKDSTDVTRRYDIYNEYRERTLKL